MTSCKAPSVLTNESVQEETHNWQHTTDSLRTLLTRSEQVIKELRLAISVYEKRIENSERIIKEYDAQGNLIKSDETRANSTTESHLQAALTESEAKVLQLQQELVGVREALAVEKAARQASTESSVTIYKVPKWCWWLLLANVLYVLYRLAKWYIKKKLSIIKI